ncbi:hypothetical protein SERLA73DRAFT_143585 [Serpula lacrymans var. lacrymans S7.3]|uniref:Uncharacterized protein n=2 Tax=Serpula lacrymans var. lacrymans TaxID=341189 RepID=F8QAD3_SERL3|nr:uncharacterized protein SERLADRAFT_400349 [Serpula lacrymans var. lacrymans S7.9]EGN94723.1 hypothetical protein SERLA73DRAFT_143585 [Serpula lacrymans var. lacrymans S7.3]EGO20202.1 hypothetical protein SERLADRAFT_400349 [Serpula lacrymans var. lacrymans S7.9]
MVSRQYCVLEYHYRWGTSLGSPFKLLSGQSFTSTGFPDSAEAGISKVSNFLTHLDHTLLTFKTSSSI